MRWRPLQRASTITFTLRTVEMCPAARLRDDNSMQRMALRAAAALSRQSVARRHHANRSCRDQGDRLIALAVEPDDFDAAIAPAAAGPGRPAVYGTGPVSRLGLVVLLTALCGAGPRQNPDGFGVGAHPVNDSVASAWFTESLSTDSKTLAFLAYLKGKPGWVEGGTQWDWDLGDPAHSEFRVGRVRFRLEVFRAERRARIFDHDAPLATATWYHLAIGLSTVGANVYILFQWNSVMQLIAELLETADLKEAASTLYLMGGLGGGVWRVPAVRFLRAVTSIR